MKRVDFKKCIQRGKKGCIGMIALCLMIVLSSCQGKETGFEKSKNKAQVNIVLLHGWGTMSKEDVLMRRIYEDFEKQNPEIRLTLVSMPSFESLEEKAKDMLAIGNIPNIIYTGAGGTDTLYRFMVEKKSAVDLMPYIEEDGEFAGSISPLIRRRWKTEENKLYTVTDLIDVKGYWYNKKIFRNAGIDKIPTTWKEFEQACHQIRTWADSKNHNTVVMDFDAKKSAVLLQAMMPEQADIGDEYPLGQNSFTFVKQLSLLSKFYRQNQIKPAEAVYKDPLFSFRIGHSAIYIGEIWELRELGENLEVGFALFPGQDGVVQTQVSAASGYLISNWGSKEQQDASVKFVKYMLSRSVQSKILWETGRIPSNPSIDYFFLQNSKQEVYRNYQTVVQSTVHKETPENSWNSLMYREYLNHVYRLIHGDIDEKRLIRLMANLQKLRK